MRLEGETVVVTGASSGLGKAMATAFLEEGANVVFAARPSDRLESARAAAEAGDPPGEATTVGCDVRSWDDVRALVRRASGRFGPVDAFVNNAGVAQYQATHDHASPPVVDTPVDAWDTIHETNLRGVFLCTKAVLPGMLERDAGRILHMSSGYGTHGRAGHTAYVASKFGLEGFHESLSLELADTGVDSLAFQPPAGGIYNENMDQHGRTEDHYRHESPEVICETAVRLAAGEGTNGGRYQATPDGEGYVEYSRADPAVE